MSLRFVRSVTSTEGDNTVNVNNSTRAKCVNLLDLATSIVSSRMPVSQGQAKVPNYISCYLPVYVLA
jgi:hypothetical protein